MRLDPDARLPSSGDQNSLKVRLSDVFRDIAIKVNSIFFQIGTGENLSEYADDTAAAAGGIAVGQFYRTGSVVKQRVT